MFIRHGIRVTLSAVVVMALAAPAFAQDSRADQAKTLLRQGLAQYAAQDFREAKRTLLKVDADSLGAADKLILTQRLEAVDESVAGQDAARDLLAAGKKALAKGHLVDAEKAFASAATSSYLSDAERRQAAAQAALAAHKRHALDAAQAPAGVAAGADAPVVAPAPTDAADRAGRDSNALLDAVARKRTQARALVAKADEALKANKPLVARKLLEEALTLDPDTPEAANTLARVQGTLGGPADNSTAIGLLERRRLAARQMVQLEITKNLRRSNELLVKAADLDAFTEAHNAAEMAKENLVKNKELFSLQDYRRKLAVIANQIAHVATRQTQWETDRVAKQRREMQRIETERITREQQQRVEQIEILTERARTLKRQRKFVESLEEVNRILELDPRNQWAAQQKDTLQQFAILMENREVSADYRKNFQRTMLQQKISEVPWWKELQYPRDWREITDRRKNEQVSSAAESDANRRVRAKLKDTIRELNFDDIELKDVIQFLRDVSGVNIYVKWNALHAAGISQNTTVNVHLVDVTLEKALRVIIDDVGATAPLGYVLNEGVVTISTRDDLATKTVTRVYDIRDLIFTVPQFAGPRLSLTGDNGSDNGTNNTTNQTGLGGLGGEDLGLDEGVSQEEVVNNIITLIKTTVRPESWNDATRMGIQEMRGQLVITQTAENHESIGELLRKLREAGAIQVSIECRFITVQDSFLERIGIESSITMNRGELRPDGTIDRNNFSHLTNELTVGGAEIAWAHAGGATGIGLDIASAGVPTALNINNAFIDDIQVSFLIQATMANANARVLTAPRITLFNGQRSYISIRRTQTYVSEFTLSREAVTSDGGTVTFNQEVTVETTDLETGTLLDVQATISDDRRYVTLTLRPQISSGTTRTLTLQDYTGADGSRTVSALEMPTTLNSEVSTTVSVPDGGTLLIGGLKRAGEREREMGVPVLSKIPVIAPLVTNRAKTRDDDALLILVKPKILLQKEEEELAFP